MRGAVLAAVLACATPALAQPAAPLEPPIAPPSAPVPPPAPVPSYAPPPNLPQPYEMTPDERRLLDEGYTSRLTIAAGGTVALVFGFGVGQAIEGRYRERGWIFTLSDSALLGTIFASSVFVAGCAYFSLIGACSDHETNTAFAVDAASVLAFLGFRIWQFADAVGGPSLHNQRVHELHRKYGIPEVSLAPFVGRPQAGDGGMTAGLTLRF